MNRASYNRPKATLGVAHTQKQSVTYYRVKTVDGNIKTHDIKEANRWKAGGLPVTIVTLTAL